MNSVCRIIEYQSIALYFLVAASFAELFVTAKLVVSGDAAATATSDGPTRVVRIEGDRP